MAHTERIPFTCTLDCGARCQLQAVVRDGQLRRLDTPPNQRDTVDYPRLIPCVRGRAHRRLQRAPERVGMPRRRVGPRGSGRFEAITWDEALDEVAERMRQLAARGEQDRLLHIIGAGSGGGRGLNGLASSRRFFSYWGQVTDTDGNMSNHAVSVAAEWMLGHVPSASERATLMEARLILLWGNNPAETHMGSNTAHYIASARDRGARVVLLDPRFTDSGVLADEWVPIRPGSDAAQAAAMAWVMETEGLCDRGWLEQYTTGYALYRDYILGRSDGRPKTPEWAEPITGVSAETTRRLAREYATVKPACLLAGWGPQRATYGEQAARALMTLACLSGNVGLVGGGAGSKSTCSGGRPVIGGLPFGPWRPRRTISIVTWAQDILEERLSPPCTMAYIVAGNVVNRSPHTLGNIAALHRLDFVVVQDPYMTPTALHADLVLPIRTDLERSDLISSWSQGALLFDARQAVEPVDQARSDYWVFARLAERLGFGEAFTQGRDEEAWLQALLDETAMDQQALRREGLLRWGEPSPVELAAFRQDPVSHPLPTVSGRIELANPQATAFGLPLVAEYVPPERPEGDDYPLQLLTPHSEVRANSCLHANPWLQRVEPQQVWISRADAESRGIARGEVVEVYNDVGVTRLPALVTERIMPGVVCIPQGAWYAPGADGVDEGGCANVLTPHALSASGGMATHSAWVQVRRCAR